MDLYKFLRHVSEVLDQIHQHDSLSLSPNDKVLPIYSHTPQDVEIVPTVTRLELWSYYLCESNSDSDDIQYLIAGTEPRTY
ncbi:hypothetical protein H4Q26_014448 [Puccinia striiformis f. sp. tritici PST-130]|nr:hypothetical protein H4Q26_014448 [Puccinia striiformis f. sp. tritici PST-130]